MKALITGGAGYIGSTIAAAMEDQGYTPIILDSLVTGRREFTRGRIFYEGDIADTDLLARIVQEHPDIQCTIHCAALIIVPESVAMPYEYYYENVVKSMVLFRTLGQLGYPNIIFSSSASIYDEVEGFVVNEQSPLKPSSPYARTKYMMEMVLQDFCKAYQLRGVALRYFNPIGSDPSMRSGVHVKNPSHVLGKMVQVAMGQEEAFAITGTAWATRDGSGLRDYIHIWDLANAHVKAMERFNTLFDGLDIPYQVINLGTGHGVTVLELVKAFETVYGQTIRKEFAPPRPGDVAGACASADKAQKLLGWTAEKSIESGIADALKWAQIREDILHFD